MTSPKNKFTSRIFGDQVATLPTKLIFVTSESWCFEDDPASPNGAFFKGLKTPVRTCCFQGVYLPKITTRYTASQGVVHSPPLVFLDEPTSGLDAFSASWFPTKKRHKGRPKVGIVEYPLDQSPRMLSHTP